MNPEEKAKSLVERFTQVENYLSVQMETGFAEAEDFGVSKDCAKQCALICVDEMIEITKIIDPSFYQFRVRKLKEVKTEIEKL